MFEPIYRRTLEDLVNKPNETKIVAQQWSMQYDPNRVNDPTYMGGLEPQYIKRAGVYNPIQTDYMPKPPQRDQRIFMKAPKPVYRPEEQPIPELRAQPSYQNQQKKKKQKPVFETLFGD